MRKFGLFAAVTAIAVAIDQTTKVWARASLGTPGMSRREIVPGFFDLVLSQNTGVAFSMLRGVSGGRWLLTLFALVAVTVIVLVVRKQPERPRFPIVMFALIAGGALGNFIDRLLFGSVTDFLLAHWHHHYWPVFNVADISLVAGVIGSLLVRPPRAEPAKK